MGTRLSGREFQTSASGTRQHLADYLNYVLSTGFRGLPHFRYDPSRIRPADTSQELAAIGQGMARTGASDVRDYALPTLRAMAQTGMPVDMSPVFEASRQQLERDLLRGHTELSERYGPYLGGSAAALSRAALESELRSQYNRDVLNAIASAAEAARERQLTAARAIPETTQASIANVLNALSGQLALADAERQALTFDLGAFARENPGIADIIQLLTILNSVPGFVGGVTQSPLSSIAALLGGAGGLLSGMGAIRRP